MPEEGLRKSPEFDDTTSNRQRLEKIRTFYLEYYMPIFVSTVLLVDAYAIDKEMFSGSGMQRLYEAVKIFTDR